MSWTPADKGAFEYRDDKGVLWRAERTESGHHWRLTADGKDEGEWTELREIRVHVEGEIK
jgi:hypothetical protein